jgi:cellulase
MHSFTSAALLTALSATRVAAHGTVLNFVINGLSYEGFDIGVFPYESDPPKIAAWTTPNTANGFISPSQYNSSDIICHENATNAQGYATVAAGDSISLQWSTWPDSHHGPVIDYLANCGDDCTTVDKTTLEFFKIDGVGLIDDTDVPGTWADDELIDANSTWLVTIPTTIAPGNYVLRHEIIALHGAESEDGAQNYPQCFNLQVTGSGTDSPAGTLGTELYTEDEAGILVNIYSSLSTYTVPGPTLYSGAISVTSQISSAITASANATTTAATVATAAAGSSSTDAAATTAATTEASSAAAAATSSVAETSAPQTLAVQTSATSQTSISATASTFLTVTQSATQSQAASTSAVAAAGDSDACDI